jgi:hypothetical protein
MPRAPLNQRNLLPIYSMLLFIDKLSRESPNTWQDLHRKLVARLKKVSRRRAEPDAGRGSRENEGAGGKRRRFREEADDSSNREDHVAVRERSTVEASARQGLLTRDERTALFFRCESREAQMSTDPVLARLIRLPALWIVTQLTHKSCPETIAGAYRSDTKNQSLSNGTIASPPTAGFDSRCRWRPSIPARSRERPPARRSCISGQ